MAEGHSFEYNSITMTPEGEPFNPAVAEVMTGAGWRGILMGKLQRGKAYFRANTPKRTGRSANSASIAVGPVKDVAGFAHHLEGELVIHAPYYPRVEFGKVNLARDIPRPPGPERVSPAFPARYLGRNVLGGDNRKVRSVVTILEK